MFLLFCSWFISFPLSQLFIPLAVPFFSSCLSGGCLFPNTFQPAYLGLYCSGFLTPSVTVPSAHRYHATISIKYQPACDSSRPRGLKFMIVLIEIVWVWLQSALSVWVTVGSFARVGFVPAQVLVCQNVFRPCAWLVHIPCQHPSSTLAITVHSWWWDPFLFTCPKTRIFVLSLVDHVSILSPLMFQQSFRKQKKK